MRNLLKVAAIGLLLSACQTSYETPYKNGSGTGAEQMSATSFRIVSAGNAYTSQLQIFDYLIVKAAETTIQHGFTHFTVTNSADMSRQQISGTPGMFIGDIYMPPTYSNETLPGGVIFIELSNQPGPQLPPATYNAAEVMRIIAPRVKAPPKKK